MTSLFTRLTQQVSDSGVPGGSRGLAHAGRVAATHAEVVDGAFRQVEQGEARGLDGHARVHPLPTVSPCKTLWEEQRAQ